MVSRSDGFPWPFSSSRRLAPSVSERDPYSRRGGPSPPPYRPSPKPPGVGAQVAFVLVVLALIGGIGKAGGCGESSTEDRQAPARIRIFTLASGDAGVRVCCGHAASALENQLTRGHNSLSKPEAPTGIEPV